MVGEKQSSRARKASSNKDEHVAQALEQLPPVEGCVRTRWKVDVACVAVDQCDT